MRMPAMWSLKPSRHLDAGPPAAWRSAVWLLLAALAAASPVAAGEPPGSAVAEEAVKRCAAIDDRPSAAESERVAQALELAEQAVAADARDAKAHLAVFCSLAKRTYITGFSLRSLVALHRMHNEIDTALALAPDYTDALLAKGALLLNLPRLLGGDVVAAERLIRAALVIEPDRISARLYLAEALSARGERAAARAQAEAALVAAQSAGRQPQADEARLLIAQLAP